MRHYSIKAVAPILVVTALLLTGCGKDYTEEELNYYKQKEAVTKAEFEAAKKQIEDAIADLNIRVKELEK